MALQARIPDPDDIVIKEGGQGTGDPVNKPGKLPKPALTPAEQAAQDAKDAEARAIARDKAAKLKTARRYVTSAADMKWQIRALKDAIFNELTRGRKQDIKDISQNLDQQLGILKEGARLHGADFLSDATDQKADTADTLEEGFRNMVRERADSVSAVLSHGAGETDAIQAMLASARNWHANSSKANRAYYDSMQSINEGITDMNVNTKTALANAHMTAEGLRESIWQKYHERRSDTMSTLGDKFGIRADYLQQAEELGLKPTGETSGMLAGSKKGMKKYYAAAANELGKSYKQKPLPDWIDNYEGMDQFDRRQENTNLASAPVFEGVQRAQGATLRKWAA